jgi:hypothetical protein
MRWCLQKRQPCPACHAAARVADLDERAGPQRDCHEAERAVRFLVVVYWGAAAFLVPWIAILLRTQPPDVLDHHSRRLWLVIGLLMFSGMVLTGVLYRFESNYAVISATFTATFLFVDAWFNILTSTGSLLTLLIVFALVVQFPISILSLFVAARLVLNRHLVNKSPRLVPVVFIVSALLTVPSTVRRVAQSTPIHIGIHQRLAWSGLDVFEFVGLLLTGWCLRNRSPWLAIVGTVTGTLLISDAMFNVITSVSDAALAGLAMAVVAELPLAVISFWLAFREIGSWAPATS